MFTLSQPVQQVIVLVVTIALILGLLLEKGKPSFLFFSAVLIFLLSGIVDINDLLTAFSNPSILSIFLLIFLTMAIKDHFNLIGWLDKLFGKAKSPKGFLMRMTSFVASFSAFINNTPIVALFMPYVYQWSKRKNISPSKLLMPLSFAAMMGGMLTVIGTSTNLVLNGLIQTKNATTPSFLDFLLPGLLVSVGGILFLYLIGYKLLPNRMELLKTAKKEIREYLVEVRIVQSSDIIGKSIQEANLRNLEGGYLFQIIRNNRRLMPVTPQEIIEEGDALVFAGDTDNILQLLKREKDFIMPVANTGGESQGKMKIVETVIPYNSDLTGHTLKELAFRENYDAAVVAIHRNGERLNGKIGEMVLEAGDLLLISPGHNFEQHIEKTHNLYLVSVIRKVSNAHPAALKGFVVVLAVVILGLIFKVLSLFFALLLLTVYMIAFKLLKIREVKRQLDVDLFVILVSSLTFSTALINSGAAHAVAIGIISLFSSFGNMGLIIGLYLITLILTSFVNHVAAVSVVFPIAYAISMQIPGMNQVAVFIAIAFAASCSFHSPFSYQTNMMVFEPGGYRLKDFLRVGFPLTLIYSILTLAFIFFYYQM